MYLEISPRRTGKTTRLVKAAEQYDGDSIVVSPNASMAARAKGILLSVCSPPVINTGVRVNNVRFMTEDEVFGVAFNKTEYQDLIMFFDEFDSMRHGVPVDDDYYYCTTPAKIRGVDEILRREDSFSKLILYNYGMYHRWNYKTGNLDMVTNSTIAMAANVIYGGNG